VKFSWVGAHATIQKGSNSIYEQKVGELPT